MASSDYLITIGIECHVQLKTKTKLFSAVDNDARQADPNTLISHIDLGMPGALPVLNEKAVELASRAAFALNTKPQHHSQFDRKHYFYPDLPMGYQITQFYSPIIRGGYVEFAFDGQIKKVRIHEAHLEADAGKSSHPAGKDYSLVDLNRAGTPLLEIVSEPDIHSPAEAKAYARELYLLMKYAQVSDVDLYYGNMRFDVNVSVSKVANKLGTRTETKNLNSFRSVEKAAEYEVKRQVELLDKGQSVVQETRGWDEAKQKTTSQRSKEEAHDYRYMPDPDIPPVELTEEYINNVSKQMPDTPSQWRERLKSVGLHAEQVELLLDTPEVVDFIWQQAEARGSEAARIVANLWVSTISNAISTQKITEQQALTDIAMANFGTAADMLQSAKVSSTAAKEGLIESIQKQQDIAGLLTLQVSDEGEIEKIVTKVLAENPKAADDVKNGELKAIGFLVGQVMKESAGQANPGVAQQLIKKQLGM